tara:strand:- start:28 stop:489 length:462 start_codon:yes stop_codon:yes gene_type:complete
MNRRELNNLIKEELSAAVQGHPSYLEEVEDMEAGDVEGGEGEEDIMDSLQGFYEKLKAHFEGEAEGGEDGEEKTDDEEKEMEDEEEAPEDVEEAKRGRKKDKVIKKDRDGVDRSKVKDAVKKASKEDPEEKEEEENALNESVKRFQKLANIRG